jgi:hypothetical protein
MILYYFERVHIYMLAQKKIHVIIDTFGWSQCSNYDDFDGINYVVMGGCEMRKK